MRSSSGCAGRTVSFEPGVHNACAWDVSAQRSVRSQASLHNSCASRIVDAEKAKIARPSTQSVKVLEKSVVRGLMTRTPLGQRRTRRSGGQVPAKTVVPVVSIARPGWRCRHTHLPGLVFASRNLYIEWVRLAAVPFECACGLFRKDIDRLNG